MADFTTELKPIYASDGSRCLRQKCPICGSENPRKTYYGDYWIEEDYYVCKECSYFEYMAYSEPIKGVVKGYYPLKYENKIKELNLQKVSDEERAFMGFPHDIDLLPTTNAKE